MANFAGGGFSLDAGMAAGAGPATPSSPQGSGAAASSSGTAATGPGVEPGKQEFTPGSAQASGPQRLPGVDVARIEGIRRDSIMDSPSSIGERGMRPLGSNSMLPPSGRENFSADNQDPFLRANSGQRDFSRPRVAEGPDRSEILPRPRGDDAVYERSERPKQPVVHKQDDAREESKPNRERGAAQPKESRELKELPPREAPPPRGDKGPEAPRAKERLSDPVEPGASEKPGTQTARPDQGTPDRGRQETRREKTPEEAKEDSRKPETRTSSAPVEKPDAKPDHSSKEAPRREVDERAPEGKTTAKDFSRESKGDREAGRSSEQQAVREKTTDAHSPDRTVFRSELRAETTRNAAEARAREQPLSLSPSEGRIQVEQALRPSVSPTAAIPLELALKQDLNNLPKGSILEALLTGTQVNSVLATGSLLRSNQSEPISTNSALPASFLVRATDEVLTRLIEILKVIPENPIVAPLIKFLEQNLSTPPAQSSERKAQDPTRAEEDRSDKGRKEEMISEFGKHALKSVKATPTDKDVLEVAGLANALQANLSSQKEEDATVTVHRITGYVYSASTGLPIAGVTVKSGISGTRTTGLLGDFSFDNIPEGSSFSVSVSKAHYEFNPPTKSGILWLSTHLEFAAVAEPLRASS